jgi:predicted  nucleic acid-binding Zn-ribbon protein
MGNTKTTFKDYIQEKIAEIKPLRDQKNKLFEDMKRINRSIEDLEYERDEIKKNLPKDIFKP